MARDERVKAARAEVCSHPARLDERSRRMMAAGEARQLGYGGVSNVSDACGLSRVIITKAMRELDAPPIPSGRIPRAYPYGIYDPGRNTGSANGTVNPSPHSFHGER